MTAPLDDPVTLKGWEIGKTLAFSPRWERPCSVPVWQELDRMSPWLDRAIKAASEAELVASSAAEWLLDNAFVVQRALVLLKQDLPPGFYRRLRPMAIGPALREPRILMLAHGVLSATSHQITRHGVEAYLTGYQSHHPLDIAELWAFPAILRLACIERLANGFAAAFAAVPSPFASSHSCEQFPPPSEIDDCVARAIANLVVISKINWKDVFNNCSEADRLLRKDPSNHYAQCDFDTRDAYRRSVERLADLARCDQLDAARAALNLAEHSENDRKRHVGFWLAGSGLPELERALGIKVSATRQISRALQRQPGIAYAAMLFACGLAGLAIPIAYLLAHEANALLLTLGIALSALPTTVLAVSIVNWLVTLTVPPRQLPKLDFSKGIDPAARTVVIVPVILGSVAEVDAIIAQLELQRLANPEAHSFVLLSDPVDAEESRSPSDAVIERALRRGIITLNRKWHGGFCLMHRERQYNQAQGCWMAWERKRGKIEQFNQFLLTGDRSAFPIVAGKIRSLIGAVFVVTADGDTRLTQGSVARLAGALAHPLNRPVFGQSGRVEAGYTLLQPRVEIGPHGVATRFARLFGGDSAIDIYSRAVSDVYHDLTGTGNYVGKGIYDVAAFTRSLEGRTPENLLLSHDLWEGLHGRAGLVSDIVVYEGFPESYAEYARRWHRWIRGDWQLLPWLWAHVPGPGGQRLDNRLSAFDRLRIWDNMRRSLVPPSVMLLLLAGWFILPGSAVVWTFISLLVPGAWLFTEAVTGMARGRRRGVLTSFGQETRQHLQRWALQLAFLPADSFTALHAISLTLLRLRRGQHLLEWTSAAQVNQLLARSSLRTTQWAATWPAPLAALAITPAIISFGSDALIAAAPLLAAWLAAPEIARWSALPDRRKIASLNEDERQYLRLVARRSWLFFERFAGATDHWLPPDNHQEAPVAATAHRTSPTNIGMMVLSALSAWRLGHLGSPEFALRMTSLLDALDRMEKWHGHLLNWYDTTSLEPLEPRYVSTVDSGNLAVSLVVLENGCRDIAAQPIFTADRLTGFADCLSLLEAALIKSGLGTDLHRCAARLHDAILASRDEPAVWSATLAFADQQLAELRAAIVKALSGASTIAPQLIEPVQDWLERSEHHLEQSREELSNSRDDTHTELTEQLEHIARRAAGMAKAMDFRPLYDSHRHLFHIGYDLSGERLDPHLYDLLASEARLASYFAIAKRDVPPEHWFQLGRPVTRIGGRTTLISWNGSMFEYLMPSLFVRSHDATLLGMTESQVVAIQRNYAASQSMPWGISESGFAAHGSDGILRYRAFGVPAIGLRRGLEEDMVVAPYASALALPFDPKHVIKNLHRLENLGALGRFGFHEAVDFTPARRTEDGQASTVSSYMAHHHGMTIAAITNAIADDAIVKWFSANQQMRSVDLILHERIPWEIPPERERLQRLPVNPAPAPALPRPQAWERPEAPHPLTHLVGNGRLTLKIGTDGCGDLVWKGHCVTEPAGRDRSAGHFMYLRDRESDDAERPMLPLPLPQALTERRVVIHPHKLEMRGNMGLLAVIVEVCIAPDDDVEIRRLRIINSGHEHRSLDFASHADLALAPHGDWHRHPAFARLFVQAHPHLSTEALVFSRRPRERDAPGVAMAQRIVAPAGAVVLKSREVSRRRTRGRWGSYRAFPEFPSDTAELEPFPLDTAAALLARIELPPQSEAEFAVVTALASHPEDAAEMLSRYGSIAALDWTDHDVGEQMRTLLARCNLPSERLGEVQRLFSALVSESGPRLRPPGSGNRQDLWGLGLSGDLPILLYEPDEQFPGDDLRFLLAAHQLWGWFGAAIDLVVLYPGAPGYVEPIRERILEGLRDCGVEDRLGQPGGITLAGQEHSDPMRIATLQRSAQVTLRGPLAQLDQQIESEVAPAIRISAFVPTMRPDQHRGAAAGPEPRQAATTGYFTKAGNYRIELGPGQPTPAPWANVLANPGFGSIVTESGLGFSFCENSGEHRLTPWRNDPLLDPPVEAIYLRDEVSGEIWSATPLPAGQNAVWQVEHGSGWTRWQTNAYGLDLELHCLVAADQPVKIVTLRLHENAAAARRLTATFFADLMIGGHNAEPAAFRTSHYRPDLRAIISQNPDHDEYQRKLAFLACSGPVHSLSTSRDDFLGLPPDWQRPAGLIAWGLGERAENTGPDASAALQTHLDIAPGGYAEITFLLGMAADEDELTALLDQFRQPGGIETQQIQLEQAWTQRLAALEVHTPEPTFDVMVNRWLPYQTISSRLFARAGFYQASGAYGFRDQLQDVTSLLLSAPELARSQILRAAQQQFEQGDVLHWWHPPTGKGVRTRCSDDLLWLPFVVAEYVAATGDIAILDEEVPFLNAPELAVTEKDRYGTFATGATASLQIHCLRAFERAFKLGSHGLPLMGDGDWNDGMNRIGSDGRGESIWLAWFMAATIRSYAGILTPMVQAVFERTWLPRADQLIAAAEQHGWDGAWYLRAFDDFGRPWGSNANEECRIDALAQAWAVIAGADQDRARIAIESAFEQLVRPTDRIARLLDPPFAHSARDPGYIMAYPPGIRENGGQYSHAAAWLGIACAMLGDGARAKLIFDRLNPACHAATTQGMATYAGEPYAVAGDISGGTTHLGRAGWTWYTGAASWAYRLATEHILGIRLDAGRVTLSPRLPPGWDGFSAVLRGNGTIAVAVQSAANEGFFINDEPGVRQPIAFPGSGKRVDVRIQIVRTKSAEPADLQDTGISR